MFESDRPIFIIGCPRSGTTLLQLMLHSHPRIAVAPETRFVIPAYFHRKVYGDMREPENRRRLAQWIATGKGTKFHELGLDRDEFVTAAVHAPGSLGSVIGTAFAEYARRFVELAYATTVHGAQGETVDRAHVAISETTGAAAAYVAMTRGRDANTAHLVADTVDEARRQWVETFARDRADLGERRQFLKHS